MTLDWTSLTSSPITRAEIMRYSIDLEWQAADDYIVLSE